MNLKNGFIAIAIACFVMLCGNPGLFAAQQNANWLGGSGNWTDATKWSGGVVPNNNATDTYAVNIDNANPAASNVLLQVFTTPPTTYGVDSVTIDAGDTLRVNGATLLTGALTLHGTLVPQSALRIGGSGALAGTGTVTINSHNANVSAVGGTLTIDPGITIRGGQGPQTDLYPASAPISIGSAGATLVNHGRIVANASGQVLTVGGSAIDNQGVLEVSPGASLGIKADFSLASIGTLINNGGSVVIMQTLQNTGQTLPVDSARQWTLTGTISGGVAAGPGSLYVPYLGHGTLANVALNTTVTVNGDLSAALTGGNGTIRIYNPEAIEGSGNVFIGTIPSGITVRGGIAASFDGGQFGVPGEKARVYASTIQGRIRAEKSIFDEAGRLRLLPNPGDSTIANTGIVEVSDGGTLIALGNLTFGSNGHFVVDGGGKLEINGNLNLSQLTDFIDVLPLSDGSAYSNYLVATYTGTRTGVFDRRTSGITISYTTPGEIRISGTPVPEPGSIGLLIGLVGGLACRRRRRRRLRG